MIRKRKKVILFMAVTVVIIITGFTYIKYSIESHRPLQLDVFAMRANYQGIQNGWYGKILKDKFNITLNIIAPNVSGEGSTLYRTRLASGYLGDVMIVSNQQLKECVEAGLASDISNDLEHSMNLAQYRLAIDNLSKYIGEKGIYGIPTNISGEASTKAVFYGDKSMLGSYMPWDYYVELGYPQIKDDEDLLRVLSQMKKNHPKTATGAETYAFSLFKDWDGGYMTLAAIMARSYGYYPCTDSVFTNEDGTKIQLLIDDNSAYHNILRLYYKANQMDLLDPDSGAQSFDTMIEKVKSKQILYLWWAWMLGNYTSNGLDGYAFVPVDNQLILHDGYSPYGDGFAIGISTYLSKKDKKRVLKFLDWSASPEGMMYYSAGIEGLSYEIKSHKPSLTKFGVTAWNSKEEVPDRYGKGSYKEGFSQLNESIVNKADTNPENGEPYDTAMWSTTIDAYKTEMDRNWEEHYDAASVADYLSMHNKMVVIPSCSFQPQPEDITLLNKRNLCSNLIVENSWNMIFAENDEEFEYLWKNMKSQLYSYGYQDVINADLAIAEAYRESKAETLRENN
jgi:ABC-type glycerol-3-phosphate transport system substrate-binding protein